MIGAGEKGFTLVELLIAIAILGLIAGAGTAMLSASLQAHEQGDARSGVYQEGLLVMERMTSGVRKTTIVVVPNGHSPTRNILAFSRLVNTDNDFYFGDPLFPRIDEDPDDYFSFGCYGIKGVDEDGDGSFDEGSFKDEDEDGFYAEDLFDGLDNDGDGSIDEEVQKDYIGNGVPGILGIDDDGDGTVDEAPHKPDDDDEDGLIDEEEILFAVYSYNSSTETLTEIHSHPFMGIYDPAPKVVLSTRVASFQVTYEAPERILIELTLKGDDGKSVTFSEYVCPRNTYQKTGKRVR
jgi:prepilin-type N-terminal cleavage/methylation domain-containing protein